MRLQEESRGRKIRGVHFNGTSAKPEFEVSLRDRVGLLLHDEAERIPAVQTVYLRPDGLEFVMTGVDGSPDLYETCAETACRIQQAIDPSGEIYVEGGWRRDQPLISGVLISRIRRNKAWRHIV